jgi:hypothetical protein
MTDPATTDYSDILNKNFDPAQLKNTMVFHLRGGIDYGKMGIIHRGMMAVVKKFAEKKPPEERPSDDQVLLETYGKKVDLSDRATIKPLVDYARSL